MHILTYGCFDLFHAGHLDLLLSIRDQWDLKRSKKHTLTVGVNCDRLVRELKGSDRPIVPEYQRAFMIDCIPWVNEVTIFHSSAALLIHDVRPDVIVKGAKEGTTVESIRTRDNVPDNVKIVLVKPFFKTSTTQLIEKIRNGR